MEDFIQDLRYARRALLANPGFTIVAIIALALGTGANSAVFSVVNGVLLRPLPYRESERLAMLSSSLPKSNRLREPVSVPDLRDYRSQGSSFEGIASLAYDDFNLSKGDVPLHVKGSMVSANFFSVLGVSARLGRTFTEDEDQAGAGRVVIISDGLWKRQFGADPGVLNQTVELNGATFTIVGITPPEFLSPEKTDELWVAMSFDAGDRFRVPSTASPEGLSRRKFRFLRCVGRLRAGWSLQQAQTEMATIASRLEEQYPDSNNAYSAQLVSIQQQIIGEIKTALQLLQLIVAVVLLVACANVANLLLARGAARKREIAVRIALGATRIRLVRQLLTESVLLALAGGAFGLALAFAGTRFLIAIEPANIPRLSEVKIDARVLGFTLLVSLATGLIFGLVPAIQSSKADLNVELKEGIRGSSEGGGGHRIRSGLVILELALTQILLITAALSLKSFYELQRVDVGFNPEGVLTMQVALPPTKYSEDYQLTSFFEQALHRIGALPGVRSAGAAMSLPLQPDTAFSKRFTIDGRPPASPNERLTASYQAVSSDFFKTMSVRLLHGRVFTDADRDKTPPVIIINDAMRRLYWGDEDPVGRHLSITAEGGVSREIVGIVGDIKQTALNSESGAEMYEPYLQAPQSFMALILRTGDDPAKMTGAVRDEILAVDPSQPVFDVKTMDQIVSESINQPRFYVVLIAIFAIVALALAAVGIYGVISYSVNQRKREIGIRIALGADPKEILRMIIGGAMSMAAIGLAIGIAAAMLFARLIEGLLYAVSSRDPVTFVVVPLFLAMISLISSYFPARRATRVDPMIALRAE